MSVVNMLLKLIFGGDATAAVKAANDTKSAISSLDGQVAKLPKDIPLAQGLGAVAPAAAEATKSVGLTTQQMGLMQFQLQDMAVGLSSGQSPFTVITQQGSQIVQMFSGGTGVLGALKAVGTGILSFVTNPLNLAVVGFGLAASAGVAFYNYITSAGSTAADVMERHEKLLTRIKDAYDANTQSLKRYSAETRNTMLAEALRDERELARALRKETGGFLNTGFLSQQSLAVGQSPYGSFGPQQSPEREALGQDLLAAIQKYNAEAKRGAPDVKAFADAVSKVSIAANGKSEDLVKIANGILDQIGPARALQNEHEQSSRLVDALTNNMKGLNEVLGQTGNSAAVASNRGFGAGGGQAFRDAQNPFQGAPSPFVGKSFLDLLGVAEGTDFNPATGRGRGYNETLGYGAFTNGPVDLITKSISEVLALQKTMLANPANTFNSSAVGRYQITAETLKDFMPRLGLDGNTIFTADVQDRIALAIANAAGRDVERLRGRWQGLDGVGQGQILSSFDGASNARAGVAQTIASNDNQKREAEAKKREAETNQAIATEARWDEVMRRSTEGLLAKNEAVDAGVYVAAKLAKEQQLLNAAHATFGKTLSSGVVAEINAEAEAYGRAAFEAQNLKEAIEAKTEADKKAKATMAETLGDMKDIASTFLRAKLNGASWGESLSSVLDVVKNKAISTLEKLLDMALFGEQGTSSGGGILNTIMGLFTGAGTAPTGVNPFYATGGVFGTAQAFAKGGSFANSIVNGETPFHYNDNGSPKRGIMGEAGPEAILPLLMAQGKLSIHAMGPDGPTTLPLMRAANGNLGVEMRAQAFASGGVFGGSIGGSTGGGRGTGPGSGGVVINMNTINNSKAEATTTARDNGQGQIDIETLIEDKVLGTLGGARAAKIMGARYGARVRPQ